MSKIVSKGLFYLGSLCACIVMAFTTGCASGGFKLTRQYARFINSKNIILRIVLYIFTSVVFAITMLIDMVIFNTLDFWQGRVSANTYEFQQNGKTFIVKHEILPSNLKRSTIEVKDGTQKILQTVVLAETAQNEIELYVDSVLRTKVDNITELPQISSFDSYGKLIEKKYLKLEDSMIAAN